VWLSPWSILVRVILPLDALFPLIHYISAPIGMGVCMHVTLPCRKSMFLLIQWPQTQWLVTNTFVSNTPSLRFPLWHYTSVLFFCSVPIQMPETTIDHKCSLNHIKLFRQQNPWNVLWLLVPISFEAIC